MGRSLCALKRWILEKWTRTILRVRRREKRGLRIFCWKRRGENASLSEGFWIGLGVGYAQEKLGDSVTDATYLNAGGLVQLPPVGWVSDTHVGLSLQQWGPKPDGNTSLAQELRLGLTSQIQRLGVSLELRHPNGQTIRPHAGFEFAAWPTVAFRLGYAGSLAPESRWSYGMGFRVGELGVDYTFLPLGNLGDTHHLGTELAFWPTAGKTFGTGGRSATERTARQSGDSFRPRPGGGPAEPTRPARTSRSRKTIEETMARRRPVTGSVIRGGVLSFFVLAATVPWAADPTTVPDQLSSAVDFLEKHPGDPSGIRRVNALGEALATPSTADPRDIHRLVRKAEKSVKNS
jgi:hypothetical protein